MGRFFGRPSPRWQEVARETDFGDDTGQRRNEKHGAMYVGNPPVLMRRPAIFNLGDRPVFESQAELHPSASLGEDKRRSETMSGAQWGMLRCCLRAAAFRHKQTNTRKYGSQRLRGGVSAGPAWADFCFSVVSNITAPLWGSAAWISFDYNLNICQGI